MTCHPMPPSANWRFSAPTQQATYLLLFFGIFFLRVTSSAVSCVI